MSKKYRFILSIILILFLASPGFSWLPGYAKRKQITVQGTNLDANQTHFPLYVYVVDADIDDECDDDGDRSFDIRFTQADDSVLDVDWIDYSEAGGNATIICFVSDAGWTINADGSTIFYIYYGNAAAGDPGTDAGVWDASYKGVWHLDEAAGHPQDSTSNVNHATAEVISTYQDAGKIYYGMEFDGANDYANIPDSADWTTTALTISGWAEVDVADADGRVIAWWDSTSNDGFALSQSSDDSGYWYFIIWVDSVNDTCQSDAAPGLTFTHVVGVRDGDGLMTLYINGAPQADTETRAGEIDSSSTVSIGQAPVGAVRFDGVLDEIRVATTDRSAEWIKFEAANVSEEDSELTWGSEESAPTGEYVPRVIWIK